MFLSPDMLTITDADYASLICNQYEFQASETTLKVTGLQPLSTIITGSTHTLGTALTDIPDPTVCNYLFCSIETTTLLSTSTYLLCFSRQFTSYTTNLIKSLFQHFPFSIQPFKSLMSGKILATIPLKRLLQSYWPTPSCISNQ